MNYYQILGLKENASLEEIKEAYKKLAFEYSPDRNPDNKEIEIKFKEITESYEYLIDPTKNKPHSAKPTKTSSNQVLKGKDIFYQLDLTLEEVYFGVSKTLTVDQRFFCQKCEGLCYKEYKACDKCKGSGKEFVTKSPFNTFTTCKTCKGSGRNGFIPCELCQGEGSSIIGQQSITIQIPKGIDNGFSLKVANFGHPIKNGVSGNLIINTNILKHNFLEKDGLDIIINIPVSYSDLVLGTDVTIPYFKKDVILNIPPRTDPFTTFKIKNLGINLGNTKGNLVCNLQFIIPIIKDEKHKELLEKLQEFEKVEIFLT